jgi:hypothetical protein
VRLLFDTHHSGLAAGLLRSDGYDVVAAADDPVLASLPDEELLRAANRADRAILTENARDFDRTERRSREQARHRVRVNSLQGARSGRWSLARGALDRLATHEGDDP